MKKHLNGNQMIGIKKNEDALFTDIRAIAKEVWPVAYGNILSSAQLDYMMQMMYSESSLQQQVQEKKHHFILATENDKAVGFASYELDCEGSKKTKIHKIYIRPNQQGKGIGKLLIDYITEKAIQCNDTALFLNVNKYNQAQHFYRKLGFMIVKEEVIDIGHGYVMDDYVMEKAINSN